MALDNVTMKIPQGEVLGVLGPNGAGKTTLFKLVAGILKPDSGNLIAETPYWPAIGYKPERLLFPSKMRIRDYLRMISSLAGVEHSDISQSVSQALEQVNLSYAGEKKIKDCSKGMRQRLALAQAMIGDPPLLLLDEPSNGLDPEGQNDICRHIKELHRAGKTIVLASHQLEEVTRVCTHIVIMNEGRIHYENAMAAALAEKPKVVILVDGDLTPINRLLKNLHQDITVNQNEITLVHEAIGLRKQVLRILLDEGYDVSFVEHKRITLAEIYEEVVG